MAVGTRNTDAAAYGGVFILDESKTIPAWINSAAGNYDVYAVAFSPNYASDRQIVAIVTDETDTFAMSKSGDAAWDVSSRARTGPRQ